MWPVSDNFARALRSSNTPIFRVDVFRAGQAKNPAQYVAGVPFTTGSAVTEDSTSQVRRTYATTIATTDLTPGAAQSLLAPYGTEVQVSRGIQFGDGTREWVPQGRFLITDASVSETGADGQSGVSITCESRARYVQDARFAHPRGPNTTLTVPQEIASLVADACPPNVPPLNDLTGSSTRVIRGTVYDVTDRAAAIDKLATSIGAEFLFDRIGVPTLRPLPDLTQTPVWTVNAGSNGVLVAVDTAISRGSVYNAVAASGQASDGSLSCWAIATDSNPASPTFWGGPFGYKPAYYGSPYLRTTAQCQAIANKLLPKYAGAGWTITLSAVPHPGLDAGDTIWVSLPDGRVQRHLIETVTVPMDYSGVQDLTTKSTDPGGDQSVSN